jgi:DAACS family dicarboxylate/amino acid:cation (Na+ or H+) symporter
LTLTRKIIVAMAAGIAAGSILNALGAAAAPFTVVAVDGVLHVIGRIFIALLQMMVVPLVFVSLVCGVTATGDLRSLGRIGAKTLGLYLLLTPIAVTVALLVAAVIGPGAGFELAGDAAFELPPAPSLGDVIIGLVPTNPVQALAEGDMLQIVVFALLFGYALTVAGEAGARLSALFVDLDAVVAKLVLLVLRAAPLGVFALLTQTFAAQGFDALPPLASYLAAAIAAMALHVVGTYGLLLKLAGLSLLRFAAKVRTVMAFAFSTSSSNATIPVTLDTLENALGVRSSVASFVVPLGATVNMDGTAIMQGAATVFIANAYGIDLSVADLVMVIVTATLASIGTAGVPGAGLIMLALVLTQVGLPVEGIGLIIGIDRLVDMVRTAVNVLGDCVVGCAVARSENALDLARFDDPEARRALPGLTEQRSA